MNRSLGRIAISTAAGGAALILCSLGVPVLRATAAAPTDRSSRQVRLMSRILDDALIESRNWLVRGSSVAQGVYLADFGAVFQFEASINSDDRDFLFGPGARVEIDKNGDGDIVVHKKRGLRDLLSGRDREKSDEDTAGLYQKGKDELVQVLADNAEVLSALPAGQAVVISVSLTDSDLKEEKDITRLLIRVSTDDLKSFGQNRLSDSELRSRIKVEES
jgi:hypothetical protein